jgi:ABC-type nitrate/sulfonate/bicarbonate transport system substrate-binding protein
MHHPVKSTAGVALTVLWLTAAAQTEREPVRLAGSSWVADAPTKVAMALDLFATETPQPEIRVDNYDSGFDALQSLRDGASDFALAASTPVARALLDAADGSGPRLAVLAAISLSNRTHVVIADAAAGIERPADLEGRRVGLMLGTSGHFGWHQFAGHHALADNAITLVHIPVDRQRDAVLSGAVDAVATWEPWSNQMRNQLGDRAREFTFRQLHSVSWLLVARETTLAEHPGLAERILRGYATALDIIDREPERALRLHAEATGTEIDDLTQQFADILWGLRLDWPVIADLETQFHWLTQDRDGLAPSIPPPNHYMHAGPLRAVDARAITLPAYFFAEHGRAP